MWKLYSLAVLFVTFYPYLASTHCYDEPGPLREFVNIAKSFTTNARVCGHRCNVETWTEDGRLYVSFETEMTCEDIPQKLCNDMFRYINKNGWMTGVTGRCETKCNNLKIIFEGEDDPNFDPNTPVINIPLKSLGDILNRGYRKAEIGDYWTTTESYTDENGAYNIVITIVVPDESQPCIAAEVCDYIRTFLDRPGVLDNSTSTCEFVDGCVDKVLLHFTGDY